MRRYDPLNRTPADSLPATPMPPEPFSDEGPRPDTYARGVWLEQRVPEMLAYIDRTMRTGTYPEQWECSLVATRLAGHILELANRRETLRQRNDRRRRRRKADG